MTENSNTDSNISDAGGRYGSRLVDQVRAKFLQTIETLAPAVLEGLRDEVLPVYRDCHSDWLEQWKAYRRWLLRHSAAKDLIALRAELKDWCARTLKQDARKRAAKQLIHRRRHWHLRLRQSETLTPNAAEMPWSEELGSAVLRWTRMHHLTKDRRPPEWVVETVESTLATWGSLKGQPPLRWSYSGEYLAKSTTGEWIDRDPDHGQIPPDHYFQWAAMHQCGMVKSMSALVTPKRDEDDNGRKLALVRFGIKRVIALVGLDLRRNLPGRPRKKAKNL